MQMQAKFPASAFRWALLLALLARVSVAILLISDNPGTRTPPWETSYARIAGDTASYLLPVENWLSTGMFEPSWRPPGYAGAYLFPRVLAPAPVAANILVVVQVVASALSVLLLTMIAIEIDPDPRLAFLVFTTFCLSTFTAAYDSVLSTESLAISGLIVLVLILLKVRSAGTAALGMTAGLLGLWVVFLRPVLGALMVGMALWLLAFSDSRRRFRLAAAFALPLALGPLLWGLRSLSVNGHFEPLGARWAPYYRPVDRSLHSFVQSFGGSLVHWDPKAEIVWFEFLRSENFQIAPEAAARITFPSDIYTSLVSQDRLLEIKERLRTSLREGIDEGTRDREQAAIAADLDRMTASIRAEQPIAYYLKAPVRVLWRHLARWGSEGLLARPWRELNLPLLAFKATASLIYIWVASFGTVGVLFLLWRPPLASGWLLVGVAFLCPLLVQTVVLRLDEFRYFAPCYPFALIFACKASLRLYDVVRFKLVETTGPA